MAIYEYEHAGKGCKLGKVFEWEQSVKDEPLEVCPECGRRVRKLISAPGLSFPKTDSELKSQGFSKLVKRDKGVYENVTAKDGESKVVKLDDQSTYPGRKSSGK